MDPFTWIALIGLIISTCLSVDSAVGNALGNQRNAEITKKATALASDISQDQELMARLGEAYSKRDAMLMNQLINSSPFGSRYYNLRKEYKSNAKKQEQLATLSSEKQKEGAKAQADLQNVQTKAASTGSAIGDLISGAAYQYGNDPNLSTYTKTDITPDTIKEVNYGQK